MKNSFIILLLLSFFGSYSQNRNSVWVFGDSAGIDFSNITNPVPITSGMDGRGSCVSMADTSGNLSFYAFTNGTTDWSTLVMNNQHIPMPNGDSITGVAWYNELQIIPVTNDTNKFYVFSYGSDVPNNEGLYYSIVDMNQNGGLGAVTVKDIEINPNRIGDCLTAVKHGNGRDWWVIAKLSNASPTFHNRFFKYLVTGDSVINYSYQDFNDARDADAQKVIWNSSYDKFMNINTLGYMSEFNFDRCSGNILLIRNIFTEQSSNYSHLFWEGAYSPNGNIFYVTTHQWFNVDSAYLLQLDLSSTNIPGNIDTLHILTLANAPGAVRLAPDNKIYFTQWYLCSSPQFYCFPYPDSVRNIYNENLGVVNYPDSLGSACNYQPYSFYLGGKRSYAGLPNNRNYDLGPLIGSFCDSLTIGIATHSKNKKVSVHPNPFKDKISFDVAELGKFKFVITDVLGKKVYEAMQQEKTEIDLSFLHQGLYIATLSNGKSVYQTKIIKQ